MPELNGIDIAKELMHLDIQVVFVTAYTQYAIEAFKVNASDYILKPISRAEVERVLNKLRARMEAVVPRRQVNELVIEFFGNFQLTHKGILLEWSTEKAADLFAYLVYHAGKKVDKWKLCDILWPDLPPEKAMHNVYNAMYRLKRLLDTHQIDYSISNKKGFYEFTIENALIDFKTMEQLLQNFSAGNVHSIEELEQMESLYQGEFLARKDYSWCQPIRAYYEQAYSKVVKQLLEYYVQHQLNQQAIALGRKVLQLYPEQEHIAMVLMPLYMRQGKRALQKFYKEYENHFTSELNSTLSKKTAQLYKNMLLEVDAILPSTSN